MWLWLDGVERECPTSVPRKREANESRRLDDPAQMLALGHIVCTDMLRCGDFVAEGGWR